MLMVLSGAAQVTVCPYCNAQLRAFERAGKTLAEAGIRVAALGR